MQNMLSKLVELLQQKMINSFLEKNECTVLCSSLSEMCLQSLELNVSAVFVLELVKFSPPRNLSLAKFI